MRSLCSLVIQCEKNSSCRNRNCNWSEKRKSSIFRDLTETRGMTVSPPLAKIPHLGPSHTFISKVGGYKYITDQYTALQSSLWGLKDEDGTEKIQKSRHETDNTTFFGHPRLGRQRYSKSRTDFETQTRSPYAGHYRVMVDRRSGLLERREPRQKQIRKEKKSHSRWGSGEFKCCIIKPLYQAQHNSAQLRWSVLSSSDHPPTKPPIR